MAPLEIVDAALQPDGLNADDPLAVTYLAASECPWASLKVPLEVSAGSALGSSALQCGDLCVKLGDRHRVGATGVSRGSRDGCRIGLPGDRSPLGIKCPVGVSMTFESKGLTKIRARSKGCNPSWEVVGSLGSAVMLEKRM